MDKETFEQLVSQFGEDAYNHLHIVDGESWMTFNNNKHVFQVLNNPRTFEYFNDKFVLEPPTPHMLAVTEERRKR